MAFTSGMFNSIGGDRKYKAENFADYFASFIGNGVFPNPSTGLKVMASSGLNVVVKPGKGWIKGYYAVNDSDYTIKLDNPDGTLKRIDRIVLRLDYVNRNITVAVKKSALSSSPTAPALQRNADAYELALADVAIGAGQLTITDANITDQRLNTNLCGIVQGLVNQVDTTTIFNQYTSWYNSFTASKTTQMDNLIDTAMTDFEEWFAGIQDILDADTAGNLLAMINAINNDTIRNPVRGVTTNSGNDYTITDTRAISAYVDDMLVIVTPNVTATANPRIRVNALGYAPIYRSNGVRFKDFYKDSKVTLRYSTIKAGFIVQGEGGGGTAVAADILAGKTAVADTGDLTGTMVNRGAVSRALNAGENYTVPVGYHNGLGIVSANTLASQTQATAVASNLTLGKTAWVNGALVTGTIPNQAATTFTPRTTNQTIPAGRYTTGTQTILGAPTLIPENIKSGVSIFGVTGTAPIIRPEKSGTITFTSSTTQYIALGFDINENTVWCCRIGNYFAAYLGYARLNFVNENGNQNGYEASLVESYISSSGAVVYGGTLIIYPDGSTNASNPVTLTYRVVQ